MLCAKHSFPTLILEVCLRKKTISNSEKTEIIDKMKSSACHCLYTNGEKVEKDITDNLVYIRFYNPSADEDCYFEKCELKKILSNGCNNVRFFSLKNMEPVQEPLYLDEEKDNLSASVGFIQTELPHSSLDELWDKLFFSNDVKKKVVGYMTTLIRFSHCSVSNDIVSANRFILLHGPPGTGKTSLAKAFANKMSIRINNVYKNSVLVEVNCHSLFSKWFSQSAKLVNLLFDKILNTYAKNEDTMVFVLIDEIESIGLSREKSMGKNDPGDVVRVLNSLLTQLDKAKKFPNIIFIGTSNMDNILDEALADRIDLDVLIGNPGPKAIYHILFDIIFELEEKNLLDSQDIHDRSSLGSDSGSGSDDSDGGDENSGKKFKGFRTTLYEKSETLHSRNISARQLRKIALKILAENFSETMTTEEFLKKI